MSMMSRVTGKPISDLDHLKQSLQDILTTRLGTRVMLREYGSQGADLIDSPITSKWATDIYYATAVAVYTWEPRFRLTSIILDGSQVSSGVVGMSLEGRFWPDGKPVLIDNLEIRTIREGAATDELVRYQSL